MDLHDKYQKSIDFWCDGVFALPEETQSLIFNSEMFLLMAYMSDYATRQIARQLNQPESIRQLENRSYQLVPVVIPIETEEEAKQRNEELNQWREELRRTNPGAIKNNAVCRIERDVLILDDSGSGEVHEKPSQSKPQRFTYGERRAGLVRRTLNGVVRQCRVCRTEYEDVDLSGGSYCSAECRQAADFHVNRMEIFARDNHTCVYCGASPFKNDDVVLHVDHIIPFSKGGPTTAENLVTSCDTCNLSKSSKDLEQAVLDTVLSIVEKRNDQSNIEPTKIFNGLERKRDSG